MDESDKEKFLSTEPYKGVRDFYPEDMFIQNYIFGVMRKTAESFGYVEYGASILEPSEIYRAKSSEEIVRDQTYSFVDRGNREVTLRPEMTPSAARMIAAKRRELSFPTRWYSIPNVFRYERTQKGRLREHFQLNADIFGIPNIEADIEIIILAHAVLKSFGLKDSQFVIKINDRGHLKKVLEKSGLTPSKIKEATSLLDKKEKIDSFEKEWEALVGKKFDAKEFDNPEIASFVSLLEERGVKNVEVDTALVRGFEYYSGIVFEIFDANEENKRSLFGGGRYDSLTSLFGKDNVPAVGFGMGDVTIRDVLEVYNLLPSYRSPTDLYICLLDKKYAIEAEELAASMREVEINTAIDFSYKKVGDQIKKADKERIPYTVCIGEEEIKTKLFKLKKLKTGEEIIATAGEIPSHIEKV